ncbi:hypothetical protein ACHAQJ_003050 [Trichoderma viride]
MNTVGAFLEPLNNGRNELGHVLANKPQKNKKPSDSANSRFSPLAEIIQEWEDFDIRELSSCLPLAACLSMACEVQWQPQIPSIARVIYGERQLEALYLQTLVTRVNIALDKAIPPDEDRVTIIVGPGVFEGVSPEASVKRILPDWIIVHGTYDCSMETLPDLQVLAKNGKILAVGDTKLVRHVDSSHALPHTEACYALFLRQLQDYCINLYTKFGFILSNKELVVAQFIREEYASPREAEQRSLRSRITAEQLESRLPSDIDDVSPRDFRVSSNPSFQSQGSFSKASENQDNPFELPVLPIDSQSIDRPLKRPHPSTSPSTSPSAARNGHPIAPASPHHVSDTSFQMSSSPPVLPTSSSQDHSKFTSSDRDVEVGAIKIQSFGMPESDGETEDISPYKALFLFIMMIRNLKLSGESITI